MLTEARHLVLPAGIVSTGFPSVRETCGRIGIGFDPWQSDLNKCVLAKTADGLLAADTVVLSIARQVGKTFDIGAVVFALCIANPGMTVVWTAHRFKVSRETFNELRALAKSPKLTPHIEYDDITTAAGNEMIPFRNGSRIVFAARERGAIRGFTKVRILILDEAQILTHAALADLAPTMNQAVDPQIILMGTPPKPSDPSEVFASLRDAALAGESEGLLYVELSAERGADPDDRAAWAQANPSYPGRTPERAIQRLRKLLSVEDFMREALGIWDDTSGVSAFDVAHWATLADTAAARGAAPVFAVATAPDRSWSAVAAAWARPDGVPQVELAEYAPGTSWVASRLAELRARWGGRVLSDTASRGLAADAVEPSQAEQAIAHNAFSDAVIAGAVRHGDEAAMNRAVRDARWKPLGDTRVLDRKGNTDISPLVAAALAVHGLLNAPSSAGWMVSLP